jgi:hypothetical protein
MDVPTITISKSTAALWEFYGSPAHDSESWSRGDIETVVERVNRGAQLLDEEKPDWVEKIIPDRLNMSNGNFCVIGQVYGEYGEYVGVPFGVGYGSEAGEEVTPQAIENGFLTDVEASDHRNLDKDERIPYALLDLVWVLMLTERSQQQGPVVLELPEQEPFNLAFQRLLDEKLLPA